MRLISLALAVLLLLIQYPLWLGKGGWLAVHDLGEQVAASRKKTDELKARNAKLDSEVRDLKDGLGAVEERARYELGMIKQGEIFIQVLKKDEKPGVMMTPLPPPRPAKGAPPGKPLND
ncbi:cell division protein FtsB [Massilia horti]|uniref:Cell division protein FtsB n=1 Tax=Massilia horti TaxID=2562153 RepID=A0A4Y9T9Y4_9BURK|nr:cell division protein FtsB [Massilia horti]TFW36160.1 cell division protein FtsB [Massilia horti]